MENITEIFYAPNIVNNGYDYEHPRYCRTCFDNGFVWFTLKTGGWRSHISRNTHTAPPTKVQPGTEVDSSDDDDAISLDAESSIEATRAHFDTSSGSIQGTHDMHVSITDDDNEDDENQALNGSFHGLALKRSLPRTNKHLKDTIDDLELKVLQQESDVKSDEDELTKMLDLVKQMEDKIAQKKTILKSTQGRLLDSQTLHRSNVELLAMSSSAPSSSSSSPLPETVPKARPTTTTKPSTTYPIVVMKRDRVDLTKYRYGRGQHGELVILGVIEKGCHTSTPKQRAKAHQEIAQLLATDPPQPEVFFSPMKLCKRIATKASLKKKKKKN